MQRDIDKIRKQMQSKSPPILLVMAFLPIFLLQVGCNEDPGNTNISPTYKPLQKDEAKGSSGERGSMIINEIGYAGSVRDDHSYDPDDVFIELWNKHPRPINPTGWRLEVRGDYNKGYVIPPVKKAIPPNGFFVIVSKKDGAYSSFLDDPSTEKNGVVIPDLILGKNRVEIELRDLDNKLIENAGSTRTRLFAGGYDTLTTRSMERSQVIFGNRGDDPKSWHANDDDNANGDLTPPVRVTGVKSGFNKYTWASPGKTNSADYSGVSAAGGFE